MAVRRAAALLPLLLAACDRGPPAALSQVPPCPGATPLTAAEIETVIAQAAGRALADGQAFTIAVTTRDGTVVGVLQMAGAPAGLDAAAVQKARTAAFLSSNQHAFTTRTAAFIIDDHFPPGLPNVPGGPLYGVQFSNLPCSDIVGAAGPFAQEGSGLSGDTGSLPLYKDGCLVGGVGVEGAIEPDDALEERAAWTASSGFRPAPAIHGSNIHVDGIRLAFVEEMPPDDLVPPTYASLLVGGATEIVAPAAAPPEAVFPSAAFGGLACDVYFAPADSLRPVPATERLLAADVTAILDAAAARSDLVRAGIRRPIGTAMRCFISVTDLDGTVLGCIRTPESTLFSLDVSIQKARTAAFFSTDTFAVTTRALGFLAQAFFPPGIGGAPEGPLHGLQGPLSAPLFGPCVPPTLPELPNGITIFPGGIALYKGGVLAGAIGVSGDGVDQDDFIAAAGADLFPPPSGARCDEADGAAAIAVLTAKVTAIGAAATVAGDPATAAAAADSATRLADGLEGIRLPYVKFPRQPYR